MAAVDDSSGVTSDATAMPDDPDGHGGEPAGGDVSFDAEELAKLAKQMAGGPFDSVMTEMLSEVDKETLQEISELLTDHFWCTLFLEFAVAVDQLQHEVNRIPGFVKDRMTVWLTAKGDLGELAPLAMFVIGRLVDEAWRGLKIVASTKAPWLGVVLSPSTARSLRILAVFTCPEPRGHPGMRQGAMRPLCHDAAEVVTDEVKRRVDEVFEGLLTPETS